MNLTELITPADLDRVFKSDSTGDEARLDRVGGQFRDVLVKHVPASDFPSALSIMMIVDQAIEMVTKEKQ